MDGRHLFALLGSIFSVGTYNSKGTFHLVDICKRFGCSGIGGLDLCTLGVYLGLI